MIIPVLMLTYNRLEYTKQAVTALMKNTKHPYKLFIVDNGSSDGTQKYLKTLDKKITVIYYPENIGVANAQNHFIKLTKDFDVLARVDNDTIVPSNWLITLSKPIKDNVVDMIGAFHQDVIPENTKHPLIKKLKKVDYTEYTLYFSSHVGGSGIVWKRSKLGYIKNTTLAGGMGDSAHQRKLFKDNLLRIAFHKNCFVRLLDFEDFKKGCIKYPEYTDIIRRKKGFDKINSFKQKQKRGLL